MNRIGLIAWGLALATLLGCQQPRDPGMPPGADFVLQTADGPMDSKDYRGKVLLVYFGYTHCPDICPASLAAGGNVLKALSAEERKRVKLVLISVDPARDSPAHIKTYASFFHPEIVGGTTAPEALALLTKAFGAGYVKQAPKADGSYAVDHTTSTYVVGPDGKLAHIFDLNASKESILSAVRRLL